MASEYLVSKVPSIGLGINSRTDRNHQLFVTRKCAASTSSDVTWDPRGTPQGSPRTAQGPRKDSLGRSGARKASLGIITSTGFIASA